ncbi:GTP-binding protein (plasmid) [Streptomyces sp. JL4002]|uniref:ATP/GTP-binding protein n=2 Tax=Streptomyces TaxID=1883 RepID=A0ABS2VRE3_STRAS|nr:MULTISPECIES: ATP/GTP-binding protein [Streptomyces]MBN0045684.1 ATP/GTP-binding protein [Streptomyces actuosus]MCQ9184614.1 ATP/GTP-binding protein [Streptomyces hayashii]QQM47526.1 ATP/GTP-binding protein [Streptomyces liliifuscus]WUC76592.1 ATP/GTP-binding protein [Streptomyces longwoodensis]
MRLKSSEGHYLAPGVNQSVKVVVLGPFAVGKTTLVGAVSEIRPASTEERMTKAGEAVDTLRGLSDKTTTTVALDFGRLTLTDDIVLYLFGGPGQPRFSFMVDELMQGALGGVVLVDTARITESWDAMGRMEEAGLPYVVAVNTFDNSPRYGEAELRRALDLAPSTPLVECDVRHRESAKRPLIALISHLLSRPSLEPAS